MPLQTTPIPAGVFGDTDEYRDRQLLGMSATLRPTFRLSEPLDGVTIRQRFAWQQTAAMWVLDVRASAGDLIRQGVAIVAPGVDLWATMRSDARMPGGQLWVSWGDARPRTPGRADWRGDARLYYRPAALVAAAAGSEFALL